MKTTKKLHTYYHKDGTVWGKGHLAGKKMEGYWVWFRKDGSKMCSGYFKKGIQAGKWTTYNKKAK